MMWASFLLQFHCAKKLAKSCKAYSLFSKLFLSFVPFLDALIVHEKWWTIIIIYFFGKISAWLELKVENGPKIYRHYRVFNDQMHSFNPILHHLITPFFFNRGQLIFHLRNDALCSQTNKLLD